MLEQGLAIMCVLIGVAAIIWALGRGDHGATHDREGANRDHPKDAQG